MAAPKSEWVSWSEAAVIANCALHVIEWHARTGRISSRPYSGMRPTLVRESVVEFAEWWSSRQARRQRNGEVGRFRAGEYTPDPTEWVTLATAADHLGASTHTVRLHTQRARIPYIKVGPTRYLNRQAAFAADITPGQPRPRGQRTTPPPDQWMDIGEFADLLGVTRTHAVRLAAGLTTMTAVSRTWVLRADAEAFAAQRQKTQAEWITIAAAAELLGCSHYRVAKAKGDGEVISRDAGTKACLNRESVLALAPTIDAERRAKQERTAARKLRLQPPDDSQEWLTPTQAAAIIGITPARVRYLRTVHRLPATHSSGRYWYAARVVRLYAEHRQYRLKREQPATPEGSRSP